MHLGGTERHDESLAESAPIAIQCVMLCMRGVVHDVHEFG